MRVLLLARATGGGLAVALGVGVLLEGSRPQWATCLLFLLCLAPAAGAILLAGDRSLRAASPRPPADHAGAAAGWWLVGPAAVLAALCARIATAPLLEARGALPAAAAAAVYMTAAVLTRGRPSAVRALLVFLVVLGAGQGLIGLVQALGGGEPGPGAMPDARPLAVGTFTNRNHLAGFLAMIAGLMSGLLIAWLERRRRPARPRGEGVATGWLALLAIGVMGLAVLLSRSRGGVLALLVTLPFAGLVWARRRGGPGRRRAAAAVAAALVVIALLGLVTDLGPFASRLTRLGTDRPALFYATLDLIADHPWVGVGAGMYRWAFRPYQTARPDLWYTHAHNDYLEIAADWGLPLAVAFWLFVFRRGWRLARLSGRASDPGVWGPALGCAAAIVAIAVHALVDFDLHIPATLACFAAVLAAGGSLLAVAGREEGGGKERTEAWTLRARGWPLTAAKAVLLALLVAAALRVAPWVAAERAALAPDRPERLLAALAATPDSPELHFRAGLLLRDLPEGRNLARSRFHLERAVALNPQAWQYRLELATLEEIEGRTEAAEEALRGAVALNPASGLYRWRLANLLIRNGDTDGALDELAAAVVADPELAPAALALLERLGLGEAEVRAAWPTTAAAAAAFRAWRAQRGEEAAEDGQ